MYEGQRTILYMEVIRMEYWGRGDMCAVGGLSRGDFSLRWDYIHGF